MRDVNFKALIVEEFEPNKFKRSLKSKKISELPEHEVLIKTQYSSLNYKDALSASGHRGVTRRYPFTPGIDAAGVVAESESDRFSDGEEVLVTGYDLGMNTSGGFQQYIRVPADWVVKLPENMTLKESMVYGTAGFTAGICINELQERGVRSGKVLVTGATGAVGSLATGMLANAGYEVIASTGKMDKIEYLLELGASEVVSRKDVNDTSGKPLLRGRWEGAIDNVGGNTLSTIIRSIKPRGAVCSVGLVGSDKFDTYVYPFILRGISLIGIDSAERPMDYRLKIWDRISKEWKLENYDRLIKETDLNGLNDEIDIILQGGQAGKVIVNLKD